jgi:hypothetical protein
MTPAGFALLVLEIVGAESLGWVTHRFWEWWFPPAIPDPPQQAPQRTTQQMLQEIQAARNLLIAEAITPDQFNELRLAILARPQ